MPPDDDDHTCSFFPPFPTYYYVSYVQSFPLVLLNVNVYVGLARYGIWWDFYYCAVGSRRSNVRGKAKGKTRTQASVLRLAPGSEGSF